MIMFGQIIDNYFAFHGRINRKPYIMLAFIIPVVTSIIYSIFSMLFSKTVFFLLSSIIFIIMTIISFSLTFRRLHDLGNSKLAYLWFFVPIINLYWTYKVFCVRGTYGDNEYGPDPLLNINNY